MLREIFSFEVRYHFKQPLIWICLVIFFLLTFGAVTSDAVTIGGSLGNVNRNAPFVIMQFLLAFSLFGVFTTTAFVANAAHRDYDLRTDSLFFTSPIKKRDYLLGRFAGSFFISVLVYGAVVGGIMIGSLMPWLEKERIGPFELLPYVWSIFVLIVPNLLLIGAIFFTVAALTRSIMATYIALLSFFVGWIVALSFAGNLDNERVASLVDPFGFAAFAIATRYWTVFERNHDVLPLEGIFLYNRLLWLGIAFVVALLGYWRFRFETGTRKSRKLRKVAAGEPEAIGANDTLALPRVTQRFDAAAAWKQFTSTIRLELVSVFKSIPFVVVLILAIANVTGNAASADDRFGATTYPVTHLMLSAIEGGFNFFALILATFYAGEIVWRERQMRVADVTDAMPVRTPAIWGAKLIALYLIILSMLTVAMLTTIAVQTAKGYHHYELGLYLRGIFLDTAPGMLLLATLAFFVQVVSGNKFFGFLLMILYYVAGAVLPALDFEHFLYRYSEAPRGPYSDMNGYGHFVQPMAWLTLYWALFAGLLVVAAHLLWVRGTESAFRQRLTIARRRFGRGSLAAAVICLGGFIATGSYIYWNTNILNKYVTSDQREELQASYEKTYEKHEKLPQPKIIAAKADVDIYPDRRAVAIRGSYELVNKTGKPLSELHVSMNPAVEKYSVAIPGAAIKTRDERHGYTIYKLATPMQPGATLPMNFTVDVTTRGFVNSNSNTDVVENGTFINNFAYFPHIGYLRFGELVDRNKRRKYGLPPVDRYPKVDDLEARMANQLSREADWISLDTTVSTSADQIALAPGYLQREWTVNGRRYFHYKTDAPILAFWSYLSARWEVKRDKWHDVAIEIYYDENHPYNVDRMIDATKKSLDYFTANFSPYQHRQVRILEFPLYQSFAQSFPNTIPYSEGLGFIADFRDPESIDYVFYITAHEVAHQWWAHQVIGGAVQGTTMITETLAQYSALMVMEKEYGRDKMKKFLRYELNRYLQGRGGELVAEMPLMLVEDQQYIHYAKGSLVFYALRDYIGEEKVNLALRNVVKKWAFRGSPYVNTIEVMNELRAVTPPDKQLLLHDLFETITIYDNRTTEAKVEQKNGQWLVTMTVESKKFRDSGSGDQKAIAIDDWIDVGALLENPKKKGDEKVLFLEKRRITQPKTTFTIAMKEKPSKAGIDPFNKLIDRNPEDNTKAVD
jgi:ABC-type transport system involved in multi-copper enzyme maturation permease subunit